MNGSGHWLSQTGNRRLNQVLHIAAVVQPFSLNLVDKHPGARPSVSKQIGYRSRILGRARARITKMR